MKTFENLIKENQTESHRLFSYIDVIKSEIVLDLLKQVRIATIKECIEKGYGLYYENIFDKNPTIVDIESTSLDRLDKNSIKIYEI
jgi:hypothetical protein